MRNTLVILAFAFFLVATSNVAFGQICPKFSCVIDSSSSGEQAGVSLDILLTEAARSGERLFVIARLGTSETTDYRNQYRLCAARDYLAPRLPALRKLIPADNSREAPSPIFAEGERFKGEGRLEFYLGSKLQLTRFIKRNRSANLNCCEDFTPKRARQWRKKCRESK